nr:PREDICTED: uncharacterized protein LOC106493276 [Apteryx mantelli mantelli]
MAQSVVYADLRFAKVPAGRSTPCQTLEAALGMDEAESPYENVQPGQAPVGQDGQGPQPSPGPWRRLRSIPVGLLAACLLLLAVAIALGGCCDTRAKRLLRFSTTAPLHAARDAPPEPAPSSLALPARAAPPLCRPQGLPGHLGPSLLALLVLLIRSTRNFLKNSDTPYWIGLYKSSFPWYEYGWLEEGDPDEEGEMDAWFWVDGSLYERGARAPPRHVRDLPFSPPLPLAVSEGSGEEQGRLNASESTVTSLRSCSNIDCCPSGWVMYRGKCLFMSAEKKTWEDSKAECDKKMSQLLITKSWTRWTVPNFLKNSDTPYWIGLYKSSFPWYEYGWLEEGDPDEEGEMDAWFWVDGSLYERA